MPSRAPSYPSLSFSTRELHFNVRKQTCTVTLSNPHQKHLAFKIKVKPTALETYVVAPSMDIVKPGASVDITVRINGIESKPRTRRTSQEKLLVQCCVLDGEDVMQSAHSMWKNLPRHDPRVIERKLVAKFEDNPHEDTIYEEDEPPENSEKDTPRASNISLPSTGPTIATRNPFTSPHDKTSQTTTPTIKLTTSVDSETLHMGTPSLRRPRSTDSLSSTSDSVTSTTSYITVKDADGRVESPGSINSELPTEDPFEDGEESRASTPTQTHAPRLPSPKRQPSPVRKTSPARKTSPTRKPSPTSTPAPPSPPPTPAPVPGIQSTQSMALHGGCYVQGARVNDEWIDFIPADMAKSTRRSCRFKKRTQRSYYNGGFSQVWTCEVATESEGPLSLVAAKELRMYNVAPEISIDQVLSRLLKRLHHEVLVWMRLSHPNIAPLVGYAFRPEFYLISPWYQLGHVRQWVADTNPSREARLKLVKGLISGMKYLHDEDLIHGDIKSDNILVSDDFEAVLIDFGLSEALDDELHLTVSVSSAAAGHCRWQAPEILETTKKTKASDIFAIGCVALEIFTGKLPYCDYKDQQLLFTLAKGVETILPGTPKEFPDVGQEIWELIQPCWVTDPEERPSIAELNQRICQICDS